MKRASIPKKVNLLDLLSVRDPSKTREGHYARIVCGDIAVNGATVRDPKSIVSSESSITESSPAFVSRGGNKLEHALDMWNINVSDKVFLDAGASTGGFTDCLLQHGSKAVHAVDVGYNQLAYKLRADDRVIVHERTNIMSNLVLSPKPHAATADLSFRSLRRAAAHILSLTLESWAIVLAKPQFEIGHPVEEFDGVLKDTELLKKTLRTIVLELSAEGVFVMNLVESPITGRKGNREFLMHISALQTGEKTHIQEAINRI